MNHRGETVCATQLRNENRSQRRGFNYAICEEEARACISNHAILRHLPMGKSKLLCGKFMLLSAARKQDECRHAFDQRLVCGSDVGCLSARGVVANIIKPAYVAL